MHPRNINARNEAARQRIITAAAALGDALGVPQLGQIAETERRDPAVAQMRELECVADLLDSVATALLTKEVASNG